MLKSTEVTTSAIVKSGPGAIGAVVLAAGSAASTVTLYDNTAASGTVLLTLKANTGLTESFTPAEKIVFSKGIYAAITGTGAAAYIMFV